MSEQKISTDYRDLTGDDYTTIEGLLADIKSQYELVMENIKENHPDAEIIAMAIDHEGDLAVNYRYEKRSKSTIQTELQAAKANLEAYEISVDSAKRRIAELMKELHSA